MGDAAETEDQCVLTSVVPIHKKKWTRKSAHSVKEDEAGPPQLQEEWVEQEVTT